MEFFIQSCVADGSYIGMIQFSSSTSVLSRLRQINSNDTSKEDLITVIPTGVGGGTGIGGGLLEGIEVTFCDV